MKNSRFVKLIAGASLVIAGLSSCAQCDHLPLFGTDCNVLSLDLSSGDLKFSAVVRADTLLLTADYNDDLSDMEALMVLSEGAVVTPDAASVRDWSEPMDFTVTSPNGSETRVYHYVPEYAAVRSRLDEDVCLTSQEQVNAFGANRYTRVRSLLINGTPDSPITDLTPLESLREVDYNLTVKGFQGKVARFDNIRRISTFDIAAQTLNEVSMAQIREINVLSIGQVLEYDRSEYIDSLAVTNFPNLETVYGSLTLQYNNFDENYTLKGFDALKEVRGNLTLSCPLKDLKAFHRLTEVNNLYLGHTIESLEGFENLKTIKGQLTVYYLGKAKTLLPFEPETIGTLNVEGAVSLRDMEFCRNIRELDDLRIHGVWNLETLAGLENLTRIENTLGIGYTGIADLDPLAALEYVGTEISIGQNRNLEDFSGLKKCLQNFKGIWTVISNKANPTIEDILNN